MKMSPTVVVHADWSTSPGKRWMALAVRRDDGHYYLHAPEPVGYTSTWLERLGAKAGEGSIFLSLDFPIGLPLAYAARAGVTDFLDLLPLLGRGEWVDFFEVATAAEEISLHRPFYPARPGNTRQQHLLDGLGVDRIDDLRRVCERGYAGRRAAAPLFWTLGAQQAGKAAIAGWREVLGPALEQRKDVHFWPFAGPLEDLLTRDGVVVAESYPAEFYGHLGLAFRPGRDSKRHQASRAANAVALLAWAATNPVTFSDELVDALCDGFGETATGEDRFDAAVGLVGMLNVLLGHRPAGNPPDEATRRIEGWILGQA
ncbi:MAG: hypothetical protein R6X18_15635 [Chloroflexota bacterium]|jgi:hypothetical protein